MKTKVRLTFLYTIIGIFIALLALGYGAFSFFLLKHEVTLLQEKNTQLEEVNDRFKTLLTEETNQKKGLSEALSSEQNKNSEFEEQIKTISNVVGDLDKLSKTDPELLAKYSKVYFLNENYTPEKLAQIDSEYWYNKSKDLYFHARAISFLHHLLQGAKNNDVELFLVSAYRSFDTQANLKSSYTVRYGSGANTFSADQGYSEHQLGTAVDFTTREVGAPLEGFGDTKEYEWLLQNAYKYGFILSYPEKNSYYVYEPWHWRFVGTRLAKRLHDEGKNFYDLDQRQIDTYLISLFD